MLAEANAVTPLAVVRQDQLVVEHLVTEELLGVSTADRLALKTWSEDFAEMLGNFQHNPEHAPKMLQTVEEMTGYFRDAVRDITAHPREGLIHSLITAEIDGDRLTEEEVIANSIVTMVGGQESTRSTLHLAELFRLADKAGLLSNPEMATRRMKTMLATRGIEP